MKLRILLVEQLSPRREHCTRCDMLHRAGMIPPLEPHFTLIEDALDMDRPPRITLCHDCAGFVAEALSKP